MLEDGAGMMSPQVALDLVLTDVVEQAHLATGATAAAVALRRGSEILCRATTGPHAPDLGTRLDQYSGLSGACVQSKTFQKCDDSETDARVDAALCRRLGIRSILVSPILLEDELLGVVEVFSPKPHAFSEREVQTVQALSRIIVHNVEHLARAIDTPDTPEPLPETLPEITASEPGEPEPAEPRTVEPQLVEPEIHQATLPVPEESTEEVTPEIAAPAVVSRSNLARSDHWTTVLIALVVIVAVALGWLMGYVPQKRSARAPSATASQTQTPPAPAVQHPNASTDANLEKPAQTAPPVPSTEPGPEKAKAHAADPAAPNPQALGGNDLVVYRDGKVIYRQPKSGSAATPSGQSAPVFLSSEVANQLLIQRVEPEYPEQARERQVQGPVTLQLTVDKDGVVQSTNVVNGDDRLAAAATSALRQWRFKPFLQQGKAEEFQTDVTVEFRLP
jgi:TonB family protein